MKTVTYFEFLTFGYSSRLKRLKIDFHELKCLFTIDNAQAVDLETMQIISYR
jgi:hypothetical protein